MIIPDVNLLLYAYFDGYLEHARAKAWWEKLLNGEHEVALPSVVIFGFMRLASSRRVFVQPMTAAHVVEIVEQWLSQAHVRFLLPGPRYLEISFRLVQLLGVAANLTTDIQIAAHALEYQGEVHSNDSDFGKFEGLRWKNPLRKGAR